VALLGSAIALHREDGRFLWPMHFPAGSAEILSAFPRANPLCHGAVCIRKEALLAVGGYREEEVFDPASDYECFWRICDQFGCANLPSVLYHYRFTGGSLSDHALTRQRMSNYMAREFARERIAGRQTDFDTAFQHAEAIVHDEASDGTLLVRTALRALLAGYYGRGLRLFSKALAHRPLSLKRWTELAAGLGFVAGPTRVKKLMNGIISRLDA
jgi:GT2 family glycosyltransferase